MDTKGEGTTVINECGSPDRRARLDDGTEVQLCRSLANRSAVIAYGRSTPAVQLYRGNGGAIRNKQKRMRRCDAARARKVNRAPVRVPVVA